MLPVASNKLRYQSREAGGTPEQREVWAPVGAPGPWEGGVSGSPGWLLSSAAPLLGGCFSQHLKGKQSPDEKSDVRRHRRVSYSGDGRLAGEDGISRPGSAHRSTLRSPAAREAGGRVTSSISCDSMILLAQGQPAKGEVGVFWDKEARLRWRKAQTEAMLSFMLPALSIVLGDPIMSLLDTIFIGQFSSTDDLAALGPNTLVFNSAQWIFNSLAVGTTSVIVNSLKAGNTKEANDSLSLAVGFGLACGLLQLVLLNEFSTSIIIATGTPERVIHLAALYMKIRALAAPAVLVTLVCQAALLAQKDAYMPCKVVLVSCVIKLAIDVSLLVGWEFGAAEAAAATVISQYVACVLLMYWNYRDPSKLHWHFRVRPTAANLLPFVQCLGPLTGVYLLKNMCYILVNSAATSQVFLAIASHQVMYSLWVLLAFCTTPLERAAITFLPLAKPLELHELEKLLIRMAISAGLGLGTLLACIPVLCPDILTHDERVWPYMRSVAPQAFISLLLNALDAAYNGILLSKQDYTFLLGAMSATLAVLYVYNSWTADAGYGISGVWWGLTLFVSLRSVAVMLRYSLRNAGA